MHVTLPFALPESEVRSAGNFSCLLSAPTRLYSRRLKLTSELKSTFAKHSIYFPTSRWPVRDQQRRMHAQLLGYWLRGPVFLFWRLRTRSGQPHLYRWASIARSCRTMVSVLVCRIVPRAEREEKGDFGHGTSSRGGGSREWRPPPSALRLQRKLPGELTGVFLLSDINECARDGGNCSHSCVNTLGSYTCVCNPGYELGMDERTCYSKSGPYFSIMAQDATAPIVRARWSDNLAFRVVQTVIMFFDMCGFDAYCALWRLQFPGANKATVLCLSDEKLALQVGCLRFGRLSMLTNVQQMRC